MQNRIIFITGRKGSGKTTLANELARSAYYNRQRVIIVAPMGGFDLTGSPVIHQSTELLNNDIANRSIIAVPGSDVQLPRSVMLYAYESGNVTLFVDEVDIFCSAHFAEPALLNIIRYGRHRQVNLVAISQRPANVIRDLTAQSDFLVMFQSTELRDLEYLGQRIGRENSDQVARLDQFKYLIYSAFDGGLMKEGGSNDLLTL